MKQLLYPSNSETTLYFFNKHVLVVGCGNSLLCEDMAMEHKGRIVGIDISQTVIKEMTEKHTVRAKENENM